MNRQATIYRLAIVFTLLAAMVGCQDAHKYPPDNAIHVPLDQVWAYGMPDTKDVCELEPDLISAQTKGLPEKERQRLASYSILENLAKSLRFLPDKRPVDQKPGFGVAGTGIEALRAARDVIVGDRPAQQAFAPGTNVSAVVFSYPSEYAITLDSVTKTTNPKFYKGSGRGVEVRYHLTPNLSADLIEHLVIIPIGKVPSSFTMVRCSPDATESSADSRRPTNVDNNYARGILGRSFTIVGKRDPTNGAPASENDHEWPDESETVPLTSIWGWQIPGTRQIGVPQPTSSNNGSLEEQQLLGDIRRALAAKMADAKTARPGFIAYGTGSDVISKAYDVMVDNEQPTRKFPSDHDLTLVFFSHPTDRSCRLRDVERRDGTIEVHYDFVPLQHGPVASHFGFIPLGKLPAGNYDVRMIQDPLPEEYRNDNTPETPPTVAGRIVCRSFQFTVADPKPEQNVATPSSPAALSEIRATVSKSDPKVLDGNLLMVNFGPYTPKPLISPDGKRVAYFSAGKLFVVDVAGGSPQQLAEFTDTLDAILGQSNYADVGRSAEDQSKVIGSDYFRTSVEPRVRTAFSLRWTHYGDGLLYAIREPYKIPEPNQPQPKPSSIAIYLAKLNSSVQLLAEIPGDLLQYEFGQCDLTANGRYLLLDSYKCSALYDLQSKTIARKFDKAVVSPDGNSIYGFDPDLKKLVSLDSELNLTNIFEVELPPSPFGDRTGFGLDLRCSPDGRFILSRNQIGFDHFSNWIGYRFELATGDRHELSGAYFEEEIEFTGNGGEIARCGPIAFRGGWGYETNVGAHLSIVPDGLGPEYDVWSIKFKGYEDLPGALTNGPTGLAMRVGPNGKVFAVAIPRPKGDPSGLVWHFMSRDGRTLPFPEPDNGKYISPYEPVGFAEDGHVLVCHDDNRLFTIPVPQE
jgi:hypothetical protein